MKTRRLLMAVFVVVLSINSALARIIMGSCGEIFDYFSDLYRDTFYEQNSFTTSSDDGSPICVTGEVSNISRFEATISGQVDPGDFDLNSATIGIILSREGAPSKSNGTIHKIDNKNIGKDGSFIINFTNLSPSMLYHYRTFFAVGNIYFYGEVKLFNTASIGFSLGESIVKNITCFSANVTCKINLEKYTRPSDIVTCGLYYSTDPEQILKGNFKKANFIDSDTCYTISLKGLESNSTYYCLPYSGRNFDYYYTIKGEMFSFTTKNDNITETGDFNLNTNSIISKFVLKGGSFDKSSYGVCYSQTNTEPTISDPHIDTEELDDENCFTIQLYPANGTTYYRAYVIIDDIPKYGEVKSFNYDREDCKEYVDLGLPSNTLWATCNIGAKCPYEFGDYFAWGETKGYHSGKCKFDSKHYKFYNEEKAGFTKYVTNVSDWAGDGSFDAKTVLGPEDDAASVLWGEEWRMPTLKEIEELLTYCYWVHTNNYNNSGAKGYIIYKRLDRDDVKRGLEASFNTSCGSLYNLSCNHIFLPFAGYYKGGNYNIDGLSGTRLGRYWTSTLNSNKYQNNRAYYLTINNCVEPYEDSRCYGHSIRPVRVKSNSECPAPEISLVQGKIKYTSTIEGVEFYGNIRCLDNKQTHTDEVELNATYEISVYAKKDGVKSETTYATLTWLQELPGNTGVKEIVIQSTPILISGYNGNITITNLEENTEVSFYTTNGIQIVSEKVINGLVHVSLTNHKGNVIIIQAGNKSGKYLVK